MADGSGYRMVGQDSSGGSGADARAQWAADRLALALEDVGFDVGRAFPLLRAGLDRDGAPVVELGRVGIGTAADLTEVFVRAAGMGVTVPEG